MGHEILECADCSHRFCGLAPDQNHVETQYTDDYFFGGGAGYADYLSEAELLISHGERYYADLISRYIPTGDILDVGAAAGFILKGFANRGWNVSGVEPNRQMAQTARTRFRITISRSLWRS